MDLRHAFFFGCLGIILWAGVPYLLGLYLRSRSCGFAWGISGLLMGLATGPLLRLGFEFCCCFTFIHGFPGVILIQGGGIGSSHLGIAWATSIFWALVYGGIGLLIDQAAESAAPHALEDGDETVGR